jgi:ribosomal protein S18 acetylase RimI-like enzyme
MFSRIINDRSYNSYLAFAEIYYMDANCFPNDTPPSIEGAYWWVHKSFLSRGVAYCAWKQVDGLLFSNYGFHYRAGVMPSARGKGLQVEMLALREHDMREKGMEYAVTYTDADGHYSMNNLIKAGYKTYNPQETGPLLSGEGRMGRVGFVHWEKKL